MQELLVLVMNFARGMWRYRWFGLPITWVLAVAGASWVYMQANVYESFTRVNVDTQSVLKPLLRGLTVESDVMTQVNLMTQVLLSRPKLEVVARESGLNLRVGSSPTAQANMIQALSRRIIVSKGRRDNLFTISYQDKDPNMAYAVVDALLSDFMEDALGANRTETTNAQLFLQDQIREYEQRLVKAEDRLAEFKKRNVGMMPGEEGGYYDRLQSEMGRSDKLRVSLNLARDRRNELLRQLEGTAPSFGLVGPSIQHGSDGSADPALAVYYAQLADLRLKYTDKHPDIVALQETIERLEAQLPSEQSRPATTPIEGQAPEVSPVDLNPVYQNIKIALSAADLEVASLDSELRQQRAKEKALAARVDTIPDVEAELRRLNRDYGVTKSQYEALLESLESARLSEQADESGDKIKFDVISPPFVPLKPVGPNRPLMLTAVFLAAVLAGAATTFVAFQIRPVASSSNALNVATGLPVLGVVSAALNKHDQSVSRLMNTCFLCGVLLLLIGFGAAITFEESAVVALQNFLSGDVS